MTGTIVGLVGNTRTGTIRSHDGSRLGFSAAGVLGDFDTLAVGHLVSFEVDRVPPRHTAVRVFREPLGEHRSGKKLDTSPDLRYAGFQEAESIRSYCFEAVASGHPVQRFIVTVDWALLLKHHIGIQEVPALCLRKLAADLKAPQDAGSHQLDDDDLFAYASSLAAAGERKRAKHSFRGRRGSPPPGPTNHTRGPSTSEVVP